MDPGCGTITPDGFMGLLTYQVPAGAATPAIY
jgi:hypothetical protein